MLSLQPPRPPPQICERLLELVSCPELSRQKHRTDLASYIQIKQQRETLLMTALYSELPLPSTQNPIGYGSFLPLRAHLALSPAMLVLICLPIGSFPAWSAHSTSRSKATLTGIWNPAAQSVVQGPAAWVSLGRLVRNTTFQNQNLPFLTRFPRDSVHMKV